MIIKRVYIKCDMCGNGEYLGEFDFKRVVSIKILKNQIDEIGWLSRHKDTHAKFKDLCPGCKEKFISEER